jgi:Flp pilus assembly protein TadD
MQGNWFHHGAVLVALAVFVAVGCRHGSKAPEGDAGHEPAVSLGNSQVADVQVALARTLEARGQSREAIPVYAEAVKNDPRRADGWVRLAVNSDKEGMFTESAEYYQKALALDPANPDTYCNLGYSLYLQQRLPEAEAALRRAIELKPDHQRAANNLGLVLARSGRDAESLEAFRRAGCPPADAHANLAYGLTLNGSLPAAREHYERALAIDTTSAPAKKGLNELAAVAPKFNEPAPAVVTPAKAEPAPAVFATPRTVEPEPARIVPSRAAEPAPQEVVPATYTTPAAPDRGTGLILAHPDAGDSARKPSDISGTVPERVVTIAPPQLPDRARVIGYLPPLQYLSAQAGCASPLDPALCKQRRPSDHGTR